jgi:heme-degrading monooxygenase HmoA
MVVLPVFAPSVTVVTARTAGSVAKATLNPDEEHLDHVLTRERQHPRMICRMWHGRTPRSKADAYAFFLAQRAIPDYRSVAGNLDVAVLRRDEGEVTHFLTVTHWESEASIRAFAGDDLLKAKYYPEDAEFLLEFEPTVQHYEVAAFTSAA